MYFIDRYKRVDTQIMTYSRFGHFVLHKAEHKSGMNIWNVKGFLDEKERRIIE